MSASDETADVRHERARRIVFGRLAPAILHETNNVLTVMAGVRQLAKAGQPLSERIGTLIDQQLAKMEELVGSIRRLAPDELDGKGTPRDLALVLDSVERLVRLAGKGRGVDVVREAGGERELPADLEALGLAALCVALPLVPSRGRAGGARLTLRPRSSGATVGIEVAFEPSRSEPTAEELDAARGLAESAGGRCVVRAERERLVAEVDVPRAPIG
jgi:hypothetical protein